MVPRGPSTSGAVVSTFNRWVHGQQFTSWPVALIGIVAVKAALLLAVKPGSFVVSYSAVSYFLLLVFAAGFAIRNGINNTLGGRGFWVLLAIGCSWPLPSISTRFGSDSPLLSSVATALARSTESS